VRERERERERERREKIKKGGKETGAIYLFHVCAPFYQS